MAGTYSATASFNVNLGGSSTCTTCPTNYDDGATGTTSINQCTWITTAGTYIAHAGDTTATNCPAGYICPSASVTYGSTNSPTICPANYYCPSWSPTPLSCASANANFPNSNPGATAPTECYTTCPAGQSVPYYGATCTPCAAGTYGSDQPTIQYLNGSACTSCPTNYDDGGTGLTSISQCAWQTNGGTYVATANSTTATNCPANFYCPSTLIYYGLTGSMLECPGAPAGSSTSDACAVYLNAGTGASVRLHGSRQTTPSLNILMNNGTRYYGNLRTAGVSDFKVNVGGTTYYMYY